MIDLYPKYKVAIQAALAASEEILSIYKTAFEKHDKEDGSPVTQADFASAKIIREWLTPTQIPITGEEHKKTPYAERKKWKQSWCIDPLDGTKEFIRRNGEFVVNIALIEENRPLFGLIASPIRKQIILGEVGNGAYQFSYKDALSPTNWQKIDALREPEIPIEIISSSSHYSGNILHLAEWIEKEYGPYNGTNMGSALKFFELVNQRADVYPRFAPTMEWDIAAGQAIYEAIGGKVVQSKTGKPLTYNKEDLTNPHFVIYNPALELEKILVEK